MRKLLFLPLLLALGCSPAPDEEKYERKFNRYDFGGVYVHEFETKLERDRAIEDRMKSFKGRGDIPAKRVHGAAFWEETKDGKVIPSTCEIYVVRWDFETIGHELTHCMHGSFHA